MGASFLEIKKERRKVRTVSYDLSTSTQRFTEDMIFYMLTNLHEKTRLDNICITGGVAQNSVANGKSNTIVTTERIKVNLPASRPKVEDRRFKLKRSKS